MKSSYLSLWSVRQNQRVGWSKVVLVAVEILLVGSKPSAAFGVRISKGQRHDVGVVLDQDVIPARESGRVGFHAESGRALRAVFDPFC